MGKQRCRVCRNKNRPDELQAGTCAECTEYQGFFNAVSNRSPEEVTGQIDVDTLTEKVARGVEEITLLLHASELHRSSVSRWLHRNRSDLTPRVTSVRPDEVGIGFTLIDAGGEEIQLWRPYRMTIQLMIDGTPVELQTPTFAPVDDDTTT